MNPEKIRQDFPILQKKVKGKPVVYFDNSCVTLKPRQVIEAMNSYYTDFTACHGRSTHYFARRTSEEYEKAREKIARFIGAKPKECIFTKNTTEGINIVANSLGLKQGDKVITTNLEHNSNLLPWLRLAKHGVRHEMTLVTPEAEFDMADFERRVDRSTKLVSIVHTSNVTGSTMPAKEIAKVCHDHGALFMLDAAQSVPHRHTDVRKLGADFVVFSGHKMLGPSGTGILYGRYDLLERMEPFLVGGETVKNVTLKGVVYEEPPVRFEPGLQNYSGAVGLGAAADYLSAIGMEKIEGYERGLAKQLYEGLLKLPRVTVYGPRDPSRRSALASFSVKGMNPHDVAIMLDEAANIFVRSGMHCAHMYHQDFLRLAEGTVRPSLYIYNTKEEVELFFETLGDVLKHFA